MKMRLVRWMGSVLIGGAALVVMLSACGGGASNATPVPTKGAATVPALPVSPATPVPAVTTAPALPVSTATPVPAAATSVPVRTATSVSAPAGNPVLARGKVIFEVEAGGVGCAFCHNKDAKGKGPANVDAPDIRTKTEADLRAALAGGVPMMTAMIKLSDDDITAVITYIHSLP